MFYYDDLTFSHFYFLEMVHSYISGTQFRMVSSTSNMKFLAISSNKLFQQTANQRMSRTGPRSVHALWWSFPLGAVFSSLMFILDPSAVSLSPNLFLFPYPPKKCFYYRNSQIYIKEGYWLSKQFCIHDALQNGLE